MNHESNNQSSSKLHGSQKKVLEADFDGTDLIRGLWDFEKVTKGSGRVWLGSRRGREEFGWGRERVGESLAGVAKGSGRVVHT